MTIFNDSAFWQAVQLELEATGWVITEASRYNPTRLVGTTPTGRAFSAVFQMDGFVEINVAGRTRSAQLLGDAHENGPGVVTAILAQWSRLPANQQ